MFVRYNQKNDLAEQYNIAKKFPKEKKYLRN